MASRHERARTRVLVVLVELLVFALLWAAAPAVYADGYVPAKFVECPGRGYQLGQFIQTAACTEVQTCTKAGGNGTIFAGGLNGSGNHYCVNSAGTGLLQMPWVSYGWPGPPQCPANSTMEVDPLTRSKATCRCAEGFDAVGDQCEPRTPILIELIGRSRTKALPAGPALPIVARVTRDGQPYLRAGNEIDIRLNGKQVAADWGPELRFTYVPGNVRAEDTLTAVCTFCSNTAVKLVVVEPCEICESVGNPIRGNGEKVQAETDFTDASPHGLDFVRHYGSQRSYQDGLGTRWSHNWAATLVIAGDEARVVLGTGETVLFTRSASNQPWAADNQRDQLAPTANGAVLIRQHDESRWEFDASGRLQSITARNGWRYVMTRDAAGQLTRVTNAFQRSLGFEYANGRLVRVTLPDGQVVSITHAGELSSATGPGACTRQYHYENTGFPSALTGISDERGVRVATFTFDSAGRATGTEHAGGADKFSLAYQQPARAATITREPVDSGLFVAVADIKDPADGVQRRTWVGGDGQVRMVGSSSPAGGIGYASRSAEALPLLETDFMGVQTAYTWDTARQLKTSITEAANTPQARATQIQWHPAFRLPVLVTQPGRTTAYEYDALGNKLAETITDTATGEARTWRWEYGPNNLPTSMTGPRGGVWRYGHDAAGNRTSVTDPLGATTRFTFDGAGRVLSQVEPNGLTTVNTFDARGHLLTQTRAGETSRYTYTASGQLASAELPTGLAVSYSYDAAGRLVGAADNRGAIITYTLSPGGHRIREEVKDAAGNIALVTGRAIDTLNRVAAIQGASGASTQLSYDSNGELVAETDPLNQTTRHTLDPLRRTVATTFVDNASVGQAWTPLDQLTEVTDPKQVKTTYGVNAFGETARESSPDIGTLTLKRDANGDVIETTDAKGQVTRITRDTLGRPVSIRYHAGSTTTFTYDSAGYVAKIEDSSGTTTFTRDLEGRVLTKTVVVNDNPSNPTRFTITYGYTRGQLTSMTYASGLKVFYRRSVGQITGIDVLEPGKNKSTIAFVSNLVHTPLGQPRSWTWSNGDSASRTFDADGRMVSNEFARYTYDTAGHMTGIVQDLWATRTVLSGTTTTTELYKAPIAWRAGYDNRNRLASFERDGAKSVYTYDANSNRLTSVETQGSDVDLEGTFDQPNLAQAANQSLKIDPASNRLLGFSQTLTRTQNGQPISTTSSTVNYAIDENGAITSDGLRTFEYDDMNRLAKVKIVKDGEAASVRYLHNALGARVFKSEPETEQTLPNEAELGNSFTNWLRKNFGWLFAQGKSKASLGQAFLYGDGEIPTWAMLGEYDNGSASGKGPSEYLWLPTADGLAVPIGTYRAGKLYAVHSDHIGTPRFITDSAKLPVWQMPYSAFLTNEPSGVLRTLTMNEGQQRLAWAKPAIEVNVSGLGRYRDKESGLTDNLQRTLLGDGHRYTQPDPIGKAGGINEFIYVNANPLANVDPDGRAAQALPILVPALLVGCALSSGCRDLFKPAQMSTGKPPGAQAANDPTYDNVRPICRPNEDDPCKRLQKWQLEARRMMVIKLATGLAPRHEIQEFNENILIHNRKCPHYPVEPILLPVK
ncbi:RHS repeat-associated core domain-containing protein [Ramlibacter albus]|uniref:RHS repeat protein n=1 Tax=Ramlibacter albus TaxID=2079448 RepID=A0A923S1D0_9BURK|nr:RHS repeat-associated core domain-containing protein [Ramlibacter albus]MBC5764151.1 RHS repeat protein [Ramlibacter albus]